MTHGPILIIEDDPHIRDVLSDELQQAGYNVLPAATGEEGLASAQRDAPRLVILDLGLPDLPGAQVALGLRDRLGLTPILVLSANDDIDVKISLLKDSANDYVTKPYLPFELLARIKAQLRRHDPDEPLTVGQLRLYPLKRQCEFEGRPVQLTNKEFDLLACLASQPGRVFPRAELLNQLWRGDPPQTASVIEVHVANVRQKLREVGAVGLVRTARGVGYGLRVSS